MNKELKKRRADHEFTEKERELYNELRTTLEDLNFNNSQIKNTEGMVDTLINILSLPNDEFKIFMPIILNEWSSVLNNPDLRFEMGRRISQDEARSAAEGVNNMLLSVEKSINDLEDISATKKSFLNRLFLMIYNFLLEVAGEDSTIFLPTQLDNGAKLPQYAHTSDSGMDLFSLANYDIAPGETVVVRTGVRFSIPEGYEIQIRNKSGIAKNTKLRIANTPGTIDAGYEGEIGVIVENIEAPIQTLEVDMNGCITNIEYGKSYQIEKGQKFAQAVLCKVEHAIIKEYDDITSKSERGEGGFGSTGLK